MSDRRLVAPQHLLHGIEHAVDQITHAQGFAHGIGQRQARRGQCGQVQMARLGLAVDLGLLRQNRRAQTSHRPHGRQHDQAAQGVVDDMKADHQARRTDIQRVHPRHQRGQDRGDQQQPDQFVQQAAQGHLAPGHVLHAGAEECQQTAADVGADHQTDRHRQADDFRACEGRRQQHGRKA